MKMSRSKYLVCHRAARLGALGTLACTVNRAEYQWFLTEVHDLRYPCVGNYRMPSQPDFDSLRQGIKMRLLARWSDGDPKVKGALFRRTTTAVKEIATESAKEIRRYLCANGSKLVEMKTSLMEPSSEQEGPTEEQIRFWLNRQTEDKLRVIAMEYSLPLPEPCDIFKLRDLIFDNMWNETIPTHL